MTLREVGENLGLTRERVRQLESQALQKLIERPARDQRAGGGLRGGRSASRRMRNGCKGHRGAEPPDRKLES